MNKQMVEKRERNKQINSQTEIDEKKRDRGRSIDRLTGKKPIERKTEI